MKNAFYFISFLLFMTSCMQDSNDKVGFCCDKPYTNVDNAINCFNKTEDGNGTSADERLLLIAFVSNDVEENQKLGWDIIEDTDIIKTAKRNYALVILDAENFKILNNECNRHLEKTLNNNQNNVVFVITNQALCWFNEWTLGENKKSIVDKLKIGNGP